jgi:hypothetical protein
VWEWGSPFSGENKTFHHLEQAGGEPKLTNFKEKSGEPKSSILTPRPAMQEVGASNCSHTSSLQDQFRETNCTRQPTLPKKAWLKHIKLIPSKAT